MACLACCQYALPSLVQHCLELRFDVQHLSGRAQLPLFDTPVPAFKPQRLHKACQTLPVVIYYP